MVYAFFKSDICAVLCFGLSLRAIISLYSYSGASKPPMFGDFEAQRHWQEITVNLLPREWYKNSSNNNLEYWGLDYPPLTAYHSYIVGKLAKNINNSYVELHKSQGIDTPLHKSFMRFTVLSADILLYLPSIVFFSYALGRLRQFNYKSLAFKVLIITLIYPGQILIDNGHFQYNNISIGFAALAISCILMNQNILSAFFFTLAMNYKQMELYHSLPFFIYLLRYCFIKQRFITNFLKIGSVVVLTCLILWIPWIFSSKDAIIVIKRLFPLSRGIFEDKVANFWCSLNVIIKLKRIFTNQQLAVISLLTTIFSLLPSATNLFQNSTKHNFLYCLYNTAMCFYLFSFQVHEKSILLAALPAIGLYIEQPYVIKWFLEITTYSMVPLFVKDGLTLPVSIMSLIFHLLITLCSILNIFKANPSSKLIQIIYKMSSLINVSLIVFCLFAPTPERFPHIYILMLSCFSFLHFALFYIYFTYKQIKL